jgi:hypothetical protein
LKEFPYEFYAELYDRHIAAELAGAAPPEFERLPGIRVNTDEATLERRLKVPDERK